MVLEYVVLQQYASTSNYFDTNNNPTACYEYYVLYISVRAVRTTRQLCEYYCEYIRVDGIKTTQLLLMVVAQYPAPARQ